VFWAVSFLQTESTNSHTFLSTKSREIGKLEQKVGELEVVVKSGRREFDQRLMGEKSTARETTTKLAREVGKYEQELGDLNMFISRKTEIEGELEDTKMELLKERKKHEQIITELERKTLQEKERLRKEMEARIREAKDTFMQMTDGQLESTTKDTMHQNEQMASELAFQVTYLQIETPLASQTQHRATHKCDTKYVFSRTLNKTDPTAL